MGLHLINILIKHLEEELPEGQQNFPLARHREGMAGAEFASTSVALHGKAPASDAWKGWSLGRGCRAARLGHSSDASSGLHREELSSAGAREAVGCRPPRPCRAAGCN